MKPTPTPELLPCPFCGSVKQMVLGPTCQRNDEYDPNTRAFPIIRCGGCFTDVPGKDWDNSGATAVAQWNRRALSVQPPAAVVGEPVARDIDWGGQAFPSEGGSDSGLYPDPGMSLRDFHASSALKGFCANPAIFAGNDYSGWALVNCTEEQLAVVCHRLADAMIAARKKVASHE